ncbi:restriction endonuclease subunit S [Bradyrhizobium ganzhouense]|uniref:restriction endonuclease subunit S n=1 Tax=Bradyrhizobium ganzhouense TaxID=1179767 RepID=UPI003CF3D2EF
MSANGQWPPMKIGDLIRESRTKGSNGSSAKKLTIRLYGRGIVASSDRGGSDATNYFIRRAGQFAYSKLDCLNGAFGIIPPHLDGYQTTLDLPAFDFLGVVDPDWFLKTVARPSFYGRFKFAAIGSRKANRVPTDEFLATRLSIPPLAEQRAIAGVLGAVEEVIASTETLIKAIADAKHATMRELLTRGIRRSNVPMKALPHRWVLGRIAEGLTHLPNDWELVTLTKVAKLESGHTPDRKEPTYWDGSIPWISLQDANALCKLTISETAETIGPEGLANSSARLLPAGTVVLQRTANVGLASIMEREMCTSQHFANWICGPKLHPQYLQQVFRHMSREWQRLMAGSVLPDIYMDTFKALQLLLPPLQEQKRIGEVGAAFDRRIELERDALEALIENRVALAQELLSGRLRLAESIIARHSDKPGKAA